MSATSNPRDAPPPRKAAMQSLTLDRPVGSLKALLTRQEHFTKLALLLLLGEAILCCLIIRFVSCECCWMRSDGGSRELERSCELLRGSKAALVSAEEGSSRQELFELKQTCTALNMLVALRNSSLTSLWPLNRHRNRLLDLHAAGSAVLERRTQLRADQGRHWTRRVSSQSFAERLEAHLSRHPATLPASSTFTRRYTGSRMRARTCGWPSTFSPASTSRRSDLSSPSTVAATA